MTTSFLSFFRPYRYALLFAGISIILIISQSCQKWVTPENKQATSEWGGDDSVDDDHHYNGQNCMNCHYSEGRGEGWFTVAGTVFGNPGDGVVRIYRDPNLAPVAEIQMDAFGNFYTTNALDFSGGLYVMIEDQNGQQKFMGDKITTGQCNLCHGVTTEQLSF